MNDLKNYLRLLCSCSLLICYRRCFHRWEELRRRQLNLNNQSTNTWIHIINRIILLNWRRLTSAGPNPGLMAVPCYCRCSHHHGRCHDHHHHWTTVADAILSECKRGGSRNFVRRLGENKIRIKIIFWNRLCIKKVLK